MKKIFCLSLLVAALVYSTPAGTAAVAARPVKISSPKETVTATAPEKMEFQTVQSTKKAESPTSNEPKEVMPEAPDKEAAVWQVVASNSRYTVAYDTQSIQYDEKKGILTLWNRWTDRTTGQKTLLLSQYDVRLRVYSDLYQYVYDGLGNCTRSGKASDASWYPLAPGTLGMALCDALKSYLISH